VTAGGRRYSRQMDALHSLAFSGKSGAGKTTLAELVVAGLRDSGRDVLQVSFADPLTTEVKALFKLRPGQKGWVDAVRKHGDARRGEDPDYWLKATADYVRRLQEAGVIAVLDDVRLAKEANYLRRAGVRLVRVEATQKSRTARLTAARRDPAIVRSPDPAECELDAYEHFAYRLHNNSSLDALRRQAAKISSLTR
jgi:hypothetical protein